MSDKSYLSLLGTILWPLIMTRPDAMHYGSFLCQFMSDPTIECWSSAIALLSYLYGTRKLGLLFRRAENLTLKLFADSSYGKHPKPMAGHCVFMNGTPVAWLAKKLKIVPLSSCEAETAALCVGCKALKFCQNFLCELGSIATVPMIVYTDSDAARLVIVNPGTTARTKHYESWMQYCRELYLKHVIGIEWIASMYQTADIFTKPLDKTTFLRHRAQLMFEPDPN